MNLETRSGSEEEFLHLLREILAGKGTINALLAHPSFMRRGERICQHIKKDREAGRELFQEACLRILVLKHRQSILSKFDIPDENAFFAWFYVLARNIDRNNYRRDHRGETHISIHDLKLEGTNLTSQGLDLEVKSLLGEFLEYIKSLPEEKAQAVNLWLSDYSTREIAEILNNSGIKCSHVTVHVWVKTALKTFLKEDEENPKQKSSDA